MILNDQVIRLKSTFPVGRFLCACAYFFFTLAVYFFLPAETTEIVVRHSGYFFLLIATALFVGYLVQLTRKTKASLTSSLFELGWLLPVWILICALLAFAHAEIGPKVLMDDAVLEATAKQLHETREIYTPTFGRWLENSFFVFDGYVDKRPILYAFLVSLVHDFTGYRAANPYLVNILSGVCFLVLVSVLGSFLAGRKGAYLMPLLWVSLPLFQQNATGSGMDMVNLFMIAAVIILSGYYWRAPTRTSEGALALAAVLLAYGRYESILFVLPVLIVIVAGWIYRGEVLLSAGSILAAPLLLGLLLQNKFFSESEALWELHSGATAAFGLTNIPDNLTAALHFFFMTGEEYANSILLAVWGIPSIIFFVVYIVRNGPSLFKKKSFYLIAALFGIFLALHFFVILCYHDGRLDRLFASRFALPSYLLLTLSITAVLNQFSQKALIWGFSIGITFIYIIGFTLPANSKAVFTHRNFVAKEITWLAKLSESHLEKHSLLVDTYTIPWTTREVSAISALQAYANAPRLAQEMAEGKYSSVYIVDRRIYESSENGPVLKPSILPAGVFDLKLIASKSFKPFELTEFYKLDRIDIEAAKNLID